MATTELSPRAHARPPAASRQACLQSLIRSAADHRALRHPWLVAVANGELRDLPEGLRRFARDYHAYASGFTGYLEQVIDKLEDPRHRALLSRNLEEENGQLAEDDLATLRAAGIAAEWIDGVSHRDLFDRFCRALGLDDRQLASPSAAAREWRRRFERFLRGASPAAAVGALGLGTENVVKPIYAQLLQGIARLPGIAPRDRVFFDLHCIVDDQHALDLNTVALELMATGDGPAELRHGMLVALRLREAFWDHLHGRDAWLGCDVGGRQS